MEVDGDNYQPGQSFYGEEELIDDTNQKLSIQDSVQCEEIEEGEDEMGEFK